MLKHPTACQTELEMVTLESLVPADHLLRKIDATIDFSFIRELTKGLYCSDNGRPPIAPEVLFIGYLFGIRSERQLMREIEVNVAYRWFLGLRLTDWVKRLYKRRKETVERSFADAKQLFGHRYARYRGITGVKWQCLLAATAQNIKKIATLMDAKGKAIPA